MLGRITLTRTFATSATPAAVWAALESPQRWPEVLNDLVSARIEPDGVLRPGAVIRTVAKPGTRAIDMAYRVVAAEPRLSLVIETDGAADFRARTEYSIVSFASGARLTVTSEATPVRWLHKITTTLARRFYTEALQAALELRMRALLTLAERIQQSQASAS